MTGCQYSWFLLGNGGCLPCKYKGGYLGDPVSCELLPRLSQKEGKMSCEKERTCVGFWKASRDFFGWWGWWELICTFPWKEIFVLSDCRAASPLRLLCKIHYGNKRNLFLCHMQCRNEKKIGFQALLSYLNFSNICPLAKVNNWSSSPKPNQ